MPIDRPAASSFSSRHVREALAVVLGFTAVFTWLYLRPILDGSLLIESDLYEYYLPIFLAPITTWSRFEFGGLPAFADPGDFTAYPLHFLFARLLPSWTALNVSAFVLAATFTYAYVRNVTGSRRAGVIAGLAYGLSEALMERLPHSSTLHAAAWLPLLVFAIDRVRQSPVPRRWIAVGALAAACCVLAGHPQPAIYIFYCAGLYAVVLGLTTAAPVWFYLRVAALFTLGVAMTAIKSLPFGEASLYMARQEVNFSEFAGHANSPAEMLSFFFPSILHEGREAPTYVGLVIVALAVAAVGFGWRRGWRTPFWAGIAVFALLMGLGDHTPLASLAFYLPLYWKFRAAARHLILAAFALCVLAGFAVAAIERGAISARVLWLACAVLAAGIVGGAAAMLMTPEAFQFEPRATLAWAPSTFTAGVWVQFGIAIAALAAIVVASRAGRTRAWVVAVGVLLMADTLYSLPNAMRSGTLVHITMPAAAAEPSVHAQRLAAEVAPLRQRLLAPGGTHRDAVLPAAWARVWQMPIAGGYGPMLLDTHNTLAQMGTNGSVAPAVLGFDDVSLDLLAVARVLIRDDELERPGTFEREGIEWSETALELTAGRADCGHSYSRELSLPLPPGVTVREVALVGHLRCGEDVPQDTEIATLTLTSNGAPVASQPLRAGVEIADRALAEPDVAARAAHRPAALFDDPDADPNTYLLRIRPATPVPADRLVIAVPAMRGWVAVDRVTVVDDRGTSHPLAPTDVSLGDARRWTRREHITTSRESDRGADSSAPGETGVTVYENRRARPRAWIATDLAPLAADDLRETIRYGQLPDGQRFDPTATVLLDRADGFAERRTFPAGGTAVVTAEADGHFEVDVDSGGGMLVLSETYYPGWTATIDGAAAPVRRVNLSLQGIELPPGRHHVTFEFRSMTLRAGRALSGLALLIAAGLLLKPVPRTPAGQAA